MDAKPDELVIALGSSHVARILEHLHEHALQTDVDFADVVPGISGETCLKVWEKLKNEASASSVTIKSQVQPVEITRALPSEHTSQVSDSHPGSSNDVNEPKEHDDDSGTTLPRPRALVYDTEDSDVEDDEANALDSPRSPSPFLAESDDDELSMKIALKARAELEKCNTPQSVVDEQEAFQKSTPRASKSVFKNDDASKAVQDHWLHDSSSFSVAAVQRLANANRQVSKRGLNDNEEAHPASLPAPTSKRTKTTSARPASTSKVRNFSCCKHSVCAGLDKCLIPSHPAT